MPPSLVNTQSEATPGLLSRLYATQAHHTMLLIFIAIHNDRIGWTSISERFATLCVF